MREVLNCGASTHTLVSSAVGSFWLNVLRAAAHSKGDDTAHRNHAQHLNGNCASSSIFSSFFDIKAMQTGDWIY